MSKLPRYVCLLTVSIVFCLSLPIVQATPPTTQPSVYLPIVQQPPVLLLSEPVAYATSQYTSAVIGEVVNVSAMQAFSVTLQAVVFDPWLAITNTLTFSTLLPATLPRQNTPFRLSAFFGPPYPLPIVHSLAFEQVIPISASTIRSLTIIPQTIECMDSSPFNIYGRITGSVRNDNAMPVTGISIVVWNLRSDSSRRGPIGLVEASITGPLAPGAEQAFSTYWFPGLCDGDKPEANLDVFQYAAQGIVMP